jgi:two-component system, OmpR family, phosphate regulon sensor histidine kinase PhoR
MMWLVFFVVIGLAGALVYIWREWGAPWREIDEIVAKISRRERPSTFLIGGAPQPRAVARALEDLFKRQAQLEEQMAERRSGADTIFAALQDGLLGVDSRRRLTLVNPAFQRLVGSNEDFVGRPLLDVIRDPALDRLIGDTLSTGEPQNIELTVTDLAHSSARRMQLNAVAVKNDAHQTTGVVVLFHDITQLRKTDEVRRDFVANVSHELRTPLSILRGYIETLRDDPATTRAELARILEVMDRHSHRLEVLVEDLLTLAQIESAHPNLQLSDVRLADFFVALKTDWAKKLAEKNLQLEIEASPDLPSLRADETRLQEILYNLLDNARKYSHVGGTIRVQAQRRSEEIVISVSDTGLGIPESDLPRVFERFYRADKARSRELGGTGLGLSIVKHIAQMHGGHVEAESQRGRGTTIRVILPLSA